MAFHTFGFSGGVIEVDEGVDTGARAGVIIHLNSLDIDAGIAVVSCKFAGRAKFMASLAILFPHRYIGIEVGASFAVAFCAFYKRYLWNIIPALIALGSEGSEALSAYGMARFAVFGSGVGTVHSLRALQALGLACRVGIKPRLARLAALQLLLVPVRPCRTFLAGGLALGVVVGGDRTGRARVAADLLGENAEGADWAADAGGDGSLPCARVVRPRRANRTPRPPLRTVVGSFGTVCALVLPCRVAKGPNRTFLASCSPLFIVVSAGFAVYAGSSC